MIAIYLFVLVCFLLWIAYRDCGKATREAPQKPAQAVSCVPVSFRAEKRGRALWSVATLPGGTEVFTIIRRETA
jgi:hypothetical protein